MALVKCKECGAEISKKAKTCPKCGAPQGPKQYSLGKLLVLIVFGVFLYSLFSGNSSQTPSPPNTNQTKVAPAPKQKAEPVFDVLSVTGKSKNEVASIIGSPKSCSSTKYGEKCVYSKAEVEIVFINQKADWITVNQLNAVPYGEGALEFIGLPKSTPSFSNSNVMRWQNKNGLLEVSIFPAGGKVDYAYIKSRTK
ncbi:zinc ribbon domain-containing protein [Desulfobacter curvatus]|uniref:zinc ribbon domain-containing protein n=1 Tax=Desulfobacter curvatus TaxID=2290 RepID=UPI00038178F1|nr:zinc ribbon domain-containing protein [Desulfobacter curvatus]